MFVDFVDIVGVSCVEEINFCFKSCSKCFFVICLIDIDVCYFCDWLIIYGYWVDKDIGCG